jgi:hypothetical protein
VTTEPENHRRWRATDRGVYEVWYLTWNHPATGQGFWLRHVLEAPVAGPAHAELWFARFDPARPERTFGIHRRFPLDARGDAPGSAPTAPVELAIAGSSLAHDRASGELSGGGHEVRWDLRWEPARTSLHLLPEVMYGGGGRGETTVLSPNPRVWMTGKLVVDGEDLVFERAVLGQTHLWGKKHAYAWAWAHCAELAGARDALLELLGVRLQRRGVTLPPIGLVALDLDGEQHRFNQFRHVVRNRASWGGGRVEFSAWSPAVKLEGELACSPRQMVNAPYLDPDGTEVFCANTEIGDARVTVWKRAGLRWREHRRLEARGRAHFEVGGRTRDPAVTREHVLVE